MSSKDVKYDLNIDGQLTAKNVILGEYGLSGGFVTLDQTPTGIPVSAGTISWNDGDGTAELILKGGLTTLQIGQEQIVMCFNDSGVPLVDGNVVYVKGAQGNRISVALATNSTEVASTVTLGIVTEPIAIGAEGFITTFGLVRKLNTLGLTEGLPIFLGATAGSYTQTKPIAPAHAIILGYVIRASATVGSIFVKVQNGWELEELHNVIIDTPLDEQVLTYETSTGLWKNKAVGTYSTDIHSNITALNAVSGTNTGDNAINTLYSSLVTNATHTGEVTGTTALTIASEVVDIDNLKAELKTTTDLGSVSGTVNIDCSLGIHFKMVLTGAITSLTFSNYSTQQNKTITIELTGNFTIAQPTTVKGDWAGYDGTKTNQIQIYLFNVATPVFSSGLINW